MNLPSLNSCLFLLLYLFCLSNIRAQFVAKSILSMGGGDIPELVQTADMDGDGKPDVLTKKMFANPVFWMKNIGDGNFVNSGKTLPSNSPGLVSMKAFDCDGDGDQDVVGAYLNNYNSKVVLWKNAGDGTFYSSSTLSSGLSEIRSLFITDIDGDGDMDIALATPYERIKWLENTSMGSSWTVHEFSFDIYASYFDFTDMDKNGIVDLLSVNEGSSTIMLNGAKIAPSLFVGNARSIQAVDLDRDGDLDIVVAQQGYGEGIIWLENDNNTYIKRLLDGSTNKDYRALTIFDYDNDGDEDIFAGCWLDCGVNVFENDGAGTFLLKTNIGSGGISEQELIHADVDGDNKIDLIQNSAGSHQVILYRNNQPPFQGIVSDFQYNGKCQGHEYILTSKARGKDIVSYEWDFGDGTMKQIGPKVVHIFPTAGSTNVTLTVRSSKGETSTKIMPVFINPSPQEDDSTVLFCAINNGGNIVVTLPPENSYTWHNTPNLPESYNNTNSNTFYGATETYVSWTGNNGCTSPVRQKITIIKSNYPNPPVVTEGAVSFSGPTEITWKAYYTGQNEMIQWVNPTDGQPYYVGNIFVSKETQTTTRYVRVINKDGCASVPLPVTASIYDHPTPAAPQFIWADATQSDFWTAGQKMIKDNQGNYFALGNWASGNFNVGNFSLPAAAGTNHYLVRYNKEGVALQANNILVVSSPYSWVDPQFVVDDDLNTYLSITFETTIKVGGITITPPTSNSRYNFIAKLNSKGEYVWHQYMSAMYARVALSGNHLIASGSETTQLLVQSYDTSTGTLEWEKKSNYMQVGGIVIDTNGDIFICGTTTAGINVATIQKFSTTGTLLWNKSITSNASVSFANDLVLDSFGNVVVLGSYAADLYPPSRGNTAVSILGKPLGYSRGIFLVKMDTSGNLLWVKTVNGMCTPTDLSISETDELFITGNYSSQLFFDGVMLFLTGKSFVASYESSGKYQWAKSTSAVKVLSGEPDQEAGVLLQGSFTSNTQLDDLYVQTRTQSPIFSNDNTLAARLGYKFTAEFKLLTACRNAAAQFEDWSTAESGSHLVQWSWDFGDGTSSTLQHPTHVYTQSRLYTVKLIITDNLSRTTTKKQEIYVFPADVSPLVDVTYSSNVICQGSTGTYSAILSNAGAEYILDWYVDDELQISASGRAALTLTGNQEREVKVSVNAYGKHCAVSHISKDSIRVPVFASLSKPQAVALATELCMGSSTTLSTTTAPVILWSTGATTSAITVNSTGSYTVQIGNNRDCMSIASDEVKINITPIPSRPQINTSGNGLCIGESVTISSASTYPVYVWSTGESTRQIMINKSLATLTLRVGENVNCLSEMAQTDVIFVEKPAAPVINPVGSSLCEGKSIDLQTQQTYPFYRWSTGATSKGIQVTTAGEYSLQAGTTANCLSDPSLTSKITVAPSPVASITTEGNVLVATPGTSYQWYKDGQLIANTSQHFSPESSGRYQVKVFNEAGCSSLSKESPVTITGIEKGNDSGIVITPNPTKDKISIFTDDPIISILLIDVFGRTLLSKKDAPYEVDISEFTHGSYILIINLDKETVTRRIVKY